VATRGVRLLTTYDLSLDEYDMLLAAQGGACAICGRTPKYNMDVDHDHALEKRLIAEGLAPLVARKASIRGLLCKPCNRRLLPAAGDSIPRLEAAIHYIAFPPAAGALTEEGAGVCPLRHPHQPSPVDAATRGS
jgi:hypothetical protein